ncbi:MAG: DUF3108 domain-containing protein [Rhodobacteraceae bacterium]|nr:DUF3108 domain-containing protein [Paracoccaceae bacterium]
MNSNIFRATATLLLTAILALAGSVSLHAAEIVEERAEFAISLAYIPIARLEYIARHDDKRYAVYTRVEAAGLGSLISDSSRRTRVTGRILDGNRVPDRYHTIQYHSDGTSSSTIIEYKNGIADRVILKESEEEQASVQPGGNAAGWDFLSIIHEYMRRKDQSTLCQRAVDAFDGKKHTVIRLEQPVRQSDGTVMCAGTYQRFANPESKDAPKTPFSVYFRPVEGQPGLYEFVKLENESKLGRLRIVRQ